MAVFLLQEKDLSVTSGDKGGQLWGGELAVSGGVQAAPVDRCQQPISTVELKQVTSKATFFKLFLCDSDEYIFTLKSRIPLYLHTKLQTDV